MWKKYWNEEIETMVPEKLRQLEADLLRKQVEYVYQRSPFYAEKFDSVSVRPREIRDQADLAKLPFTEKVELTESQRDGTLFGVNQCAPKHDIVRIVGTGGTSGQPLRLAFTRKDLLTYQEFGARALWSMGCRPDDVIINCFNYSIYSGGVLGQTVFEYLGAAVLPFGVGQSLRLLDLMAHLKSDLGIYATPSYAVRLIERAEEAGVDLSTLGVKKAFLSGEAGLQLPGYRERIESKWGMTARDLYGTSEVGAHSAECEHLNGLHYFGGGLAIAEFIDPATKEVKPITQQASGELVFTSLTREAGPVIRFRSHDLVEVYTDPCPCGRTGFRFQTIGRSDDMFVVKGVNVYPLGIQDVLSNMQPRLTGEFQVILNHPPPIDYSPVLRVEVAHEVPLDGRDSLKQEVRGVIRERLGFTPEVQMIDQGQIATEHKTRRVYRVYKGITPPELKERKTS